MRSRKTGGPKAGPGRQHKWDSTNKTVEVDGWIWHHLKRYDHLNKVFGCILDTELRKLPLVWPCKVHVCRSRRLPCQRINLTKLLLGILPCTWSPLDFNKTSHDRTCQEFPVPGSFGWSGSLQKPGLTRWFCCQGYGFIEFRQESVAKIVAQTMHKILGKVSGESVGPVHQLWMLIDIL